MPKDVRRMPRRFEIGNRAFELVASPPAVILHPLARLALRCSPLIAPLLILESTLVSIGLMFIEPLILEMIEILNVLA